MKPIDIFITAYSRPQYTRETLRYLKERTRYPYRLFLIDNGGNAEFRKEVDYLISLRPNMGIHAAWNVAASLAESDYFITSDNDIYVPDLEPDWLTQLVGFMDQKLEYGAISLHPHIFIGIAGEDPNDPEDVKEAPMCGAVMRIMRTDAVKRVGGWLNKIDPKRNSEERTICSRLHSIGYKTGRTVRIRAYHPFGKKEGLPWGYPIEITPEMQGHNPQLVEEVWRFDNPESYDPKTWLPL